MRACELHTDKSRLIFLVEYAVLLLPSAHPKQAVSDPWFDHSLTTGAKSDPCCALPLHTDAPVAAVLLHHG
jgi:hypothetical protein